MTRRFVQQMADGDAVDEVYLVVDKQLRANRNGNLYLQMELRDRTGSISARLWNAGDHLFRSFDAGDFLLVKGKVQLFQGALQMILSHLERIESEKVELADFLPHTEQDVSKLFERLRSFLLKLDQSAPARAGRMLPDGPGVRAQTSARRRPAFATITPTSADCWSMSSRCSTPPTAWRRSTRTWTAICCSWACSCTTSARCAN